jgi:hypothetical protein
MIHQQVKSHKSPKINKSLYLFIGGDLNSTPGEDDDDDSSASSSSSSDEETKGKQSTLNKNPQKKIKEHSQNDEGEVSSVTTRQNKTERNHYILRMAIDEKFIPASIKNLRFAA